jgi:predicted Kef-type K+ transport protein
MLAAWIGGALILGLAASRVGVPPLAGFLIAGFAFGLAGFETSPFLIEISEAGVLLLLFAVGLKLRVKTLLRFEVWGTALGHLVVVAVLALAAIRAVAGVAWPLAVTLAIALGFSSTVFSAKVLEEQKALRAVHGRIAIGILVVQDLVAGALLTGLSLATPSPYALLLLALPFAGAYIGRLLDFVGHGELLVLFGVALAVGGGYVFETLGVSPELGALALGMALAEHRRAQELSTALWGLKEFFLVGFFLTIGVSGEPTWATVGHVAWLMLLLPLKCVAFFAILLALGLRARTSFLTTASLATYSEFGLIVAQSAVANGNLGSEWLVASAIAVALSFLLAAPVNALAYEVLARFGGVLERFERDTRHPDDEPVTLGSAEILVVGMGRVGTGAYEYLRQRSDHVVGADSDPGKIERHLAAGRRVVYADAEDVTFWKQLHLGKLKAIMLSFPDVRGMQAACRELRARGFSGLISATHLFGEDVERILEAGADVTYNYFTEAGVGFARDSWEALEGATEAESASDASG